MIELSEMIVNESNQQNSQNALYFDKTMSIGQIIDVFCKMIGIKQVTDYDRLNETQLYMAFEDANSDL